jgi:hypothetical protein
MCSIHCLIHFIKKKFANFITDITKKLHREEMVVAFSNDMCTYFSFTYAKDSKLNGSVTVVDTWLIHCVFTCFGLNVP